MHRDDRDDPFDDIFREIERMMEEMTGGNVNIDANAGFGGDAHFAVYEEADSLRVVGDLPGVEQDAIDVKCDGRTLTVSAATDHREYEERISLPTQVEARSATASFNNGVLEILLERSDESANIDLD